MWKTSKLAGGVEWSSWQSCMLYGLTWWICPKPEPEATSRTWRRPSASQRKSWGSPDCWTLMVNYSALPHSPSSESSGNTAAGPCIVYSIVSMEISIQSPGKSPKSIYFPFYFMCSDQFFNYSCLAILMWVYYECPIYTGQVSLLH